MKIEIREGYDIVIIAENERDHERLKKLNDKYAGQGLTFDLVAGPGYFHSITIRPLSPEERVTELGG
jgi:hypothetical protein